MANFEETFRINSTDQDMFAMDDTDHDSDYHTHSLSRLSMCNSVSNSPHKDDPVDGDAMTMTMYMSKLSIESFDGDADVEFSDEKEDKHLLRGLSSDSDKDELSRSDWYSMPGTPRTGQRRKKDIYAGIFKEYSSENEVIEKGLLRKKMNKRYRLNRRRMVTKERWIERNMNAIALDSIVTTATSSTNPNFSCSGESDQGLLVITRPKGGRRSLCMDMEEVKACNDLGFELEHEGMLEIMPPAISISVSTLDTSSGGNSPIASWRISSPGDNPRDVKARLKVWAQAVALASTSGPSG